MPGSGKSALGKRVASKLLLPYLDTDTYLTEKSGMDTATLFATYGEQHYRDAETKLLQNLITATPGIISTGGGLCLREENQAIMKNHGVIVLIYRPIEDIMQNVRPEKRPYLAEKGIDELKRIYDERMPIYKNVADIVMNNGNGFHAGLETLEKIVSLYK